MSKLSKMLVTVGAIAGVAVVMIVLSRRPDIAPENDLPVSGAERTSAATAETNHSTFFTRLGRRHPAQSPAGDGTMAASSTATNLIADWEGKVDDLLGSASSDPDKAKRMLEMFPHLPPDGQEEVARHLTNLVPDRDYDAMRAYLTNAALPAAVLEVLFGDVLNRPNSLKLPALLDVARTPQHPEAGEARDFLQLYLEADYGSDWGTWQAKMDEWLQANPD
jgi:hypothetical protein